MKIAVVTGATSGIGFEVAKELLKRGYTVLATGRREEKIKEALSALKDYEGDVIFYQSDFSFLKNVFEVADKIKKFVSEKNEGKIDALINNAGCVRSYYMTTVDGMETQFQVNYLSAFVLTSCLMPNILKARGRILFTSSGSHKNTKVKWKDIMYKRHYSPLFAYKQSKLLVLLLAYEINKRYYESGVHAYGVDPGLVNTEIGLKETCGIVKLVWKLRKNSGVSPTVPAATYSYLCIRKTPPENLYYYKSAPLAYSKQVNVENASRLWELSEKYAGITFGEDKRI